MNNVALDIETETRSFYPKQDTRRILSIQLGTDVWQELYYADGKPGENLADGVTRIRKLAADDVVFVGHYIKKFDCEHLSTFCGVNIQHCEDTFTHAGLSQLSSRSLASACSHFGIPASHKHILNSWKAKAQSLPEFKSHFEKCVSEAQELHGISREDAQRSVLKDMLVGWAIMCAYADFVSKPSKKHDFYQYAIGDVKAEYLLFKKLEGIE
ncbi:MAG: hypothetical protein V1909_00565 [Candidatus Micrarchaeota archaeon]